MPITVRIPDEIALALADIARFENRISVSDLTREWIVSKAQGFLRNPTYQRWLKNYRSTGSHAEHRPFREQLEGTH